MMEELGMASRYSLNKVLLSLRHSVCLVHAGTTSSVHSLVRMWGYINVIVLQLSNLQMVPHLPLALLLGGALLFSPIERTRI